MKERNAKKRTGVRRAALALLAALLLSLAPVSQPTEAAGATNGTVEMVRWTRVRTMNDLPTDGNWHYAMFAMIEHDVVYGFGQVDSKDSTDWITANAGNVTYFPYSQLRQNASDKSQAMATDCFITYGPNITNSGGSRVSVTGSESGANFLMDNGVQLEGDYFPAVIKYVGTDESTSRVTDPKFGIDEITYKKIWGINMPFNFNFNYRYWIRIADTHYVQQPGNGRVSASYYLMTESGGKLKKKAKAYYDDDGIIHNTMWNFQWNDDQVYGPHIFHYDKGAGGNEGLNGDHEKIQLKNNSTKENEFAIWVGEPVYYAAITTDYTVRSGEVLNIDGETILMDGVTLTIEPGAVLSVQGTFINNGTILNCGTVYLREEACMMPLDATKSYAGKIICVGGERYGFCAEVGKNGEYRQCCGDLILNHNARLMMYDSGRLYLQDGATLVNNGGIVMTHTPPLINSSTLLNREGGQILFHVGVENIDRFFLPVAKQSTQTGVDGLKTLSNVKIVETYSSSMLSIEDALIVNEGNMYSASSGLTGLVTTRGKGRTFSDQDKDITTASSTNYSTDHYKNLLNDMRLYASYDAKKLVGGENATTWKNKRGNTEKNMFR